MEEFFDILSNLEVRFSEGRLSKSMDRTPTAVFQFVARSTNKFLVQVDANCHFKFEAFYKHKNQLYPHPYTLQTQMNPSSVIEHYQGLTYEVSLYLELKRLDEFKIDDLKRYYEAIDKNIDINEEIHDFHDVYLILHYESNRQSVQFQCNNNQPMHLPKFISNPWTHTNTLTRFRYDAENRDGTFPCEMTLRHTNLLNLQSYKIVLCLISNTIPARMDYHAIRWICKLKPRVSRQNGSSTRQVEKEKSYSLNHPSGIVIAQVFGPDRIFSPHLIHSTNNLNYVRSYFEPEGFRTELHNSMNKDTSTLAIAVIKGTDYPIYMKNRRKDLNILRYLPFNELDNVNNNLEIDNEKLIKRLKDHKDKRSKQLILFDENEIGTYSQAHVRLYVAAYDENDVLLTEALHPPLRNNKTFEQLRIIRIVQPKHELHANESAYVYCDYDYNKSRLELDICPFEFELAFTRSMNTPTEEQCLRLFDNPHISIRASFVPNCACLLQFQVPNDPRYHKHRIFIRLRHRQSKDYNPSAVALCDNLCWTYHADTTSVMDMMLESNFNNPSSSNWPTPYQTIELELHPVDQHSIPSDFSFESDDSNHSNRRLNTPDLELPTTKRFSFSNVSPEDDSHQ